MYKIFCRVYQWFLKFISNFLPWREPELLQGENSINRLPQLIKSKGINNVLIVTGKVISSIGLMDSLTQGLDNLEIDYTIYNKTVANPTIDNIEEALKIYKTNQCRGIIAFGGGSPLDCAKGVGARIARPNKGIPQMKGVLKVRKNTPPIFAVPTTAGTGSEVTIAAVITDSQTHEKYAINDLTLIPHYAVLDPTLTLGLPKSTTSTTGMDALTHAVEAFIGRSNTKETKMLSKKAIKLIYNNIFTAYSDGENIEARKNMLKASYYAGAAFTRAYVGLVHAIAHALGGLYGIPHGLANAIILPYVLEYYGETAYKPLAELTDLLELGEASDTIEEKANRFISEVKKLNEDMNIPKTIIGIKKSDIPLLVERIYKEVNPLYPVPKIPTKADISAIIYEIMEQSSMLAG